MRTEAEIREKIKEYSDTYYEIKNDVISVSETDKILDAAGTMGLAAVSIYLLKWVLQEKN